MGVVALKVIDTPEKRSKMEVMKREWELRVF